MFRPERTSASRQWGFGQRTSGTAMGVSSPHVSPSRREKPSPASPPRQRAVLDSPLLRHRGTQAADKLSLPARSVMPPHTRLESPPTRRDPLPVAPCDTLPETAPQALQPVHMISLPRELREEAASPIAASLDVLRASGAAPGAQSGALADGQVSSGSRAATKLQEQAASSCTLVANSRVASQSAVCPNPPVASPQQQQVVAIEKELNTSLLNLVETTVIHLESKLDVALRRVDELLKENCSKTLEDSNELRARVADLEARMSETLFSRIAGNCSDLPSTPASSPMPLVPAGSADVTALAVEVADLREQFMALGATHLDVGESSRRRAGSEQDIAEKSELFIVESFTAGQPDMGESCLGSIDSRVDSLNVRLATAEERLRSLEVHLQKGAAVASQQTDAPGVRGVDSLCFSKLSADATSWTQLRSEWLKAVDLEWRPKYEELAVAVAELRCEANGSDGVAHLDKQKLLCETTVATNMQISERLDTLDFRVSELFCEQRASSQDRRCQEFSDLHTTRVAALEAMYIGLESRMSEERTQVDGRLVDLCRSECSNAVALVAKLWSAEVDCGGAPAIQGINAESLGWSMDREFARASGNQGMLDAKEILGTGGRPHHDQSWPLLAKKLYVSEETRPVRSLPVVALGPDSSIVSKSEAECNNCFGGGCTRCDWTGKVGGDALPHGPLPRSLSPPFAFGKYLSAPPENLAPAPAARVAHTDARASSLRSRPTTPVERRSKLAASGTSPSRIRAPPERQSSAGVAQRVAFGGSFTAPERAQPASGST